MLSRRLAIPLALAAAVALLVLTRAPGAAADDLLALGVRVALWGTVLLAGAELAAALVGSRLGGAAHLVWDGGAGLALVAGLLLWLGRIPGAFRRPVLLGFVALLAVAAAAVRVRRRALATERQRWPVTATVVTVLLAAVGLAWNRVPPLFFDSLTYHFANPHSWLVDGRAGPMAWSLHSWFPPGASLLYGLGLAFGGDAAASDANLLGGLLLGGLVFELTRRLWSDAAGWVALALLLTTPLYLHALAIPAADLLHGMFGFGAIGCWLVARAGDQAKAWRRRAGLFIAGALLTKYLGLLLPAALVVVLFWWWPPRGEANAPGRLRAAVLLSAPGVLLLAPWLLANHAVTASPVAPIFAADALAPGGAEAFREAARGGLPGLGDLIELGPRLFTGSPDESRIYPTPAWGWVPAALLPAALLWARDDRRLRAVLTLAAVGFGGWLLSYRWERFLVAVTALLVVAIGGAAPAMWRRGGVIARAIFALVILTGVLTTVRAGLEVQRFTGGAAVALGVQSGPAFLARSRPGEVVYTRAAELLDPARHRVLVIGDSRHHRLAVPHVAPSVYNRHPWVRQANAVGDGPAAERRLSDRLLEAGFSHVIIDRGAARAYAGHPSLGELGARSISLERHLASLGPPLAEAGDVVLHPLPPAR